MTDRHCQAPIPFTDLIDYWTGDLGPAAEARIEEHVFTCGECARALADVEALGRRVAGVAQHGRLHTVVTDGILNRLAADGLRIRSYTLEGTAVVPCAVWTGDDLIVARIRADFTGVESVTIVTRRDSGEEIARQSDIAVRPGQHEILNAFAASRLRRLPATLVHVAVMGTTASGERPIAEYTLDHAGALERLAGQR